MEAPREWPENAPAIKSRHVTLIARDGKDLCWATTVQGKREILERCGGQLWAVWTGNYTSHLFSVPRGIVRRTSASNSLSAGYRPAPVRFDPRPDDGLEPADASVTSCFLAVARGPCGRR